MPRWQEWVTWHFYFSSGVRVVANIRLIDIIGRMCNWGCSRYRCHECLYYIRVIPPTYFHYSVCCRNSIYIGGRGGIRLPINIQIIDISKRCLWFKYNSWNMEHTVKLITHCTMGKSNEMKQEAPRRSTYMTAWRTDAIEIMGILQLYTPH